MNRPRPRRCLPAVLVALALSCLASATAMAQSGLTFETSSIEAQNYTVGATIVNLTLPGANGGTGTLAYTLMPDANTAIPGLTFDASARTLAGTPTTPSAAAVALTYTVTDANSMTANLTFMVTVHSAPTLATGVPHLRYTASQEVAVTLPVGSGGFGTLSYTLTRISSDPNAPVVALGLTFNALARTISGTPIQGFATTPAELRYTVLDANGGGTFAPFTMRVFKVPKLPPIGPQHYTVGTAVNLVLSASGGFPPLTYTLTSTSSIPVWMTLETRDRTIGAITGTPDAASTFELTVAVTDVSSITTEQTFMVTVHSAPTFADATTIPNQVYTADQEVALTLPAASGGGFGTLSYVLTRTNGGPGAPIVAPGLTDFDPETRTISGTTSQAYGGDDGAKLRYTVWDANGASATRIDFTMQTVAAPTFAETIDEQGYAIGDSVAVTLPEASDGVAPLSYTLARDDDATPTLPIGLTFNPMTPSIEGTPSEPFGGDSGSISMRYTATDANGVTAAQTFTLRVFGFDTTTIDDQAYTRGIAITPLTLPPAIGGGDMPIYTLTPVPAGLTFDAGARTLTGTPTIGSTALTLTYTVTDADGVAISRTFMVTVYVAMLSIADVEVGEGEGDGMATVTVRLDNQVLVGFRVDATTVGNLNDSAVAGADYTAVIGQTLTFAGTAGEEQTFNVTILDDAILEVASETVTLSLNNLRSLLDNSESSVPVNISATATLTIIDDETGLTVTSVGYFADAAASLTITQAAQGSHIYLVVQFSENVENVNYNPDTGDIGQPKIDVQRVNLIPGGAATTSDTFLVIAPGTAFTTINACRAESASKYLCLYNLTATGLGSTGPGPLRVVVKAGNVLDSALNPLAMDYVDLNGIKAVDLPEEAPTVESIKHYSDPADIETATVISSPVEKGEIYSVIQFNGLHIDSLEISYQIGDAVQVQFGRHTTGGTPQNGTCALLNGGDGTVLANQSFWCRYNTRTGDTGTGDTSIPYKVIVGTGTTDTAGRPLDADADVVSSSVMLDVTTSIAILSIEIEDDGSVNEGDGTATVRVTVDDAVPGGFSVDAMTADDAGTATKDEDYTAVSGQRLSFAGTFAGETQTFTVTIIDDAIYESGESGDVVETVVVLLGDPVSNTEGTDVSVDSSATATISITDNEYQVALTMQVVLTMEDFGVRENAGTATVIVSLDTAVPDAFSVLASTADGIATAPGDYTTVSQTLNFAGTFGETQTFSVPITNDTTPEFPETLTVSLSNLHVPTDTATRMGTLRPVSATITIMDNDIDTKGINLNLIFPVTVDGKTYFYLDHNGNGIADFEDQVSHNKLQLLLNNSGPTADTQEGVHNGQDDARSVIVGDTTVILPTRAELETLGRSLPPTTAPVNWRNPAIGGGEYWTSSPISEATFNHDYYQYQFYEGESMSGDQVNGNHVAFQVRTLPTFSAGIADQAYTVGQTVTLTLPEADGGVGTLSYTLTRIDNGPRLPPGLTFDPVKRTISDMPTVGFGSGGDGDGARLLYTVTDATRAARDIRFRLRVAPAPALVAIDAQTYATDIAVNQTLPAATGGTAPLTYTLTPTALIPEGLTFDAATQSIKSIEGMSIMETDAVTLTLTYTVTDANGITAEQPFTVTVNAALVFDNTIIPIPDPAYTYIVGTTITPLTLAPATGGGTPLTYTLTPLPAGLTFNADADPRTLTGTPTAQGDAATLTYTVTDANGITTEQTFKVTVNDVLVFDDTFIPILDPAYFYTAGTTIPSLTLPPATGGGGMLSYTLMPIPAGLSFDPDPGTRTLTGIPTTGSTAVTLTYTATDADGMTNSLTFMVTVYAATLSIADVGVGEAAGTATVTVSLDKAVPGGFMVDATATGGTATAGADYTAVIGHTLTFAGTGTETQTFSVDIKDDSLFEAGSETVTLSLGNLRSLDGSESSVPVNISATATLTIIDDDIGLSVTSVGYFADASEALTITEAALGARIYLVVEFSENVENVNTDFDARVRGRPEIEVQYVSPFPGQSTTSDAIPVTAYDTAFTTNACRAESESNTSKYLCQYTVQSGTTSLGPLRVEVDEENAYNSDGDTLTMDYEDLNSVVMVVNTPDPPMVTSIKHYSDAADLSTATEISDTDTVIDGAIYSVIQFEGLPIASPGPEISYQIGAATVPFRQVPFSVHATDDTPQNETCALLNGGDGTADADQSFWCRYNPRTGQTGTTYQVIVGTGTTDIADQPLADTDTNTSDSVMLEVTAGTATLSIEIVGDDSVNEGAGTATVRVTVDDAVIGGFRVDAMTADGTGTATADEDYTTFSDQTLSFDGEAGETQTFSVTILDDDIYEGGESGVAETVVVSLGDPVGNTEDTAVSVDSSATATISITDNEYLVVLTMEDFSVNEGAGMATVIVSLDNAVPDAFSVVASTTDGTATAPGDYTAIISQTLAFTGTFTGTVETRTVSVPIINDSMPELTENLTLLLSDLQVTPDLPNTAITEGTLRPVSATISIRDDDINTRGINLHLIYPVTVNGKTYSYLDHNGNGRADLGDNVKHQNLDALLNGGSGSQAIQDGVHNGRDDERAVIVGDTILILPTVAELMELRKSQSGTAPANWANPFSGNEYWAADRISSGFEHYYAFEFTDGIVDETDPVDSNYTAFQVRPFVPNLTFGEIIADQTYTVGQTVALTLPQPDTSFGALNYTLTRLNGNAHNLPDGLTFNAVERTISGIPSETFSGTGLRYTATDAAEAFGDVEFTLRVNAALAFDSTISALDPAYTYVAGRDITLLSLPRAIGGTTPLTYTLTPTASIPDGLIFDPDARTLTGKPTTTTAIAAAALTYTITEANGAAITAEFTLTVHIAPTFDISAIPAPDSAYTYTVGTTITPLTLPPAIGGGGMLSYTLMPLPAGLAFDAGERTLTGTPTTQGNAAALTYTVTDANSITTEQTFTVTVNDALVFDDTSIPIPDSAYFYTVETTIPSLTLPPATGGGGMLSYTLMPVPAGLSFDAGARTLTGTPASESTAVTLTYTATDADGMTISRTFMVTVYAATLSFITDVEVNEGDGMATFIVSLDNAVPGGFTVDATTHNDSAVAGSDYTAVSGQTLTFAGTVDETQTFSVTILDDDIVEAGSEIATLSLDNLRSLDGSESSVPVNISATATLTILDDETGLTVKSVGYYADAAEALTITQVALGTHMYIVIQFSENVRNADTFISPTEPDVTGRPGIGVRYMTGSSSSGNLILAPLFVIAPGSAFTDRIWSCRAESAFNTSKYICQFFALNGAVGEGPLHVEVDAGDVHTSAGNTLAMNYMDSGIRVVNTPARPTVMSIKHYSDPADIETATEISSPVEDGEIYSVIQFEGLPIASPGPEISYQIGTASDAVQVPFGSHTTGGTPQNGTCALLDGGDGTAAANQSFWCRYNPRSGETDTTYQVIVGTGTTDTAGQTLADESTSSVMLDVTTGTATLSIEIEGDGSVNEGAGTATVRVTVDDAVTGGFSVVAMTADGTATDGLDYTAVLGQTLSFAGTFAGETLSFTVPILDDAIYEGGESGAAETVVVSLGDPVGNTVGTAVSVDSSATAIISIADNDYQVALTMEDVSVNESAGSVTVSVSLDTAVPDAFSVVASTTDGTATAPGDYTITSETLSFTGTFAGETRTISVPITNDDTPELTESLTLLLSTLQVTPDLPNTAITEGTLRPVSATITIMDDDINTGDINLNLLFPVTFNGKTYSYLDHNGNGIADPGDVVKHDALATLLNGGSATQAIQDGAHNGRDDERAVIVGDTILILPTVAELMDLRESQSDTAPASWANPDSSSTRYWAANPASGNLFFSYKFDTGEVIEAKLFDLNYTAFQVRPFVLNLTFGETIADQTYTVGQTVALTLPQPVTSFGALNYTLARLNGDAHNLPDGLTFDAGARTISGIPSETFSGTGLRYTATDAAEAFGDVEFTLRVNAALAFDSTISALDPAYTYVAGRGHTPLSLPRATGGTTPLTYTLTPTASIPVGLDFDAGERTLTGTPTTTTAITAVALTYTITDANGVAITAEFTLAVHIAPTFDISAIPAPDSAYTYLARTAITPLTLPPATGVAPLTYTLMPLPDGLIFNADADPRTLTGTPTARGDAATLTYTVTDMNSVASSLTFMVTIDEVALSIADVNVNEGDGEAIVSVVLNYAVDAPFSVVASTEDGTGTGTAIAGQDYTAVSHSLSFTGTPAGETLTFSVPIIDDTTTEDAETLTVFLGTLQNAPASGIVISDRATITIMANDTPTDTLALGTDTDSGLNLNLLFPVTTNGKTYYYLDNNGDDSADIGDSNVTHIALNNLLNSDNNTKDTQDGEHNGQDDERAAIVGDYVLILPTHDELVALRGSQSNPIPANWLDDTYWTATNPSGNIFRAYTFQTGQHLDQPSGTPYATAFQVQLVPPSLTFGETITAQNYTVGQTVALTLPEAGGGSNTPAYTLTPEADIPAGLTFDATARSLKGTPTTATTVTLTYAATAPNAIAVSQTFMVTVNAIVPAAPTDVTLTPGNTQISVSWTPANNGGAKITKYTATATDTTDTSNTFPCTATATATGAAATTCDISRLMNDREYSVTVVATNSAGDSEKSTAVSATPTTLAFDTVGIDDQFYTVGTAIPALTLPGATGGIGTLSYSLTPEADIPAGLTFDATARSLKGTPTTATATAVTLTYAATATNAIAVSQTFMVTVNAIVPAAPTDVTLTPGNTQISVSWTPVPDANNGGAEIIEYTATATNTAGTFTCTVPGATATACDISDLTNKEEYSVTVVATNSAGDSEKSTAVSATPMMFAFDTVSIADQFYTVGTAIPALTLPVATGGIGTLSYSLTPKADIPAGLTFDATARSLKGTPTTATATAVTLTYAATATNAVAVSLTFMVTVNAIVPAAPTNVTLTPGNTQISVSWTPVPDANNGGAEIIEYTATATNTAGTFTCTVPGATATACDISNLTNKEEYSVTVVATNSAGDSEKSTAVSTTPTMFAFDTVSIADQFYTVDTAIPALTLPGATGGIGTLSYSLTPEADIPAGLTFDPATRILSGMPSATGIRTLTYTVTDSNTPPASIALTFSVKVSRMTAVTPGDVNPIMLDLDGDADGILILPAGHEVTRVDISTPPVSATSNPPVGVEFSLTTDLALIPNADLAADATVCLPITGITAGITAGLVPALYYYTSSDTWEVIGDDTSRTGFTGLVCGETRTFSPFAVGIKRPVVTITDSIERIPDIANSADGDVIFTITFENAVTTGFTRANHIRVNGGTPRSGTPRTLVLSGTGTYTLAVNPFNNINGTISVTVLENAVTGQTNTNGNAEVTATQRYDTLAPAAPIFEDVTGDNIINAAERDMGVTLAGTNEDGAVVTLCIVGGSGEVCTGGTLRTATPDTTTNWSYALATDDITAMGEGAETLTATATDAVGNPTQATHDIRVDTIAPVFSSGAKGVVLVGPESTATAYDADATDNDGVKDVGITYALSGDDANEFNIVADTGVVNYQNVQNTPVIHNIVITATDTAGNTVTQAVEISTANLTITALADQNIAENTVYSATPSINGTPAGTLTWSLGGDDAEHFSIDSTTGTVTLTERDYEVPTDNGKDNTYRFTLIATDTDNSIITSAVTTITITDANVIGAGLTLTPTSLTVDEGSMTYYTVALAAVPAGPDPVIVDINQNGEVTTSPVTLSFTTATWDTAQTVTLTAVEDDDAITEDITLMHTTSGDDYDVTATLTVTVTDNDPRFDTTIADQVYLAGATITTLTLPSAIGGTGMLTYTLMPSASIPVGLTFINNAAARTLTGRPTTASATTPLIYTVIDSADSPLPAILTFSVTVVAVTVPDGGKAEADETGKTIAVDYDGDGDNDLLLTLPTLTGATTFTVGTYDPLAEGTPAPAGVAFSRTANIDTSGTPAADTTVCLSTIGVPEGSDPALYHYTTASGQLVDTWKKIGSDLDTRGDLVFVCGTTTIFSPFAVGTVTDNDPRFDTTIADQVYLTGATITTLTLPSAIGGTGMLTYTLTPLMPSASIPVGLTFIDNATARTLAGTPTTASATTPLIYTVMDSAASPLAILTFSVTVVAVTVPDGRKAEADETSKTIAVDYVGDGDNDLLLILPTLTGATTFTVGTYDPLAEDTPAPAGVVFSRTANIDTSGTPAADTTVCLSTIGVPEGSDPALYHYTTASGQIDDTWNKIGSDLDDTRGDLVFVCGLTTIFSPFAVGYDDPTVVIETTTTTRLNEQILTRASQAMTASTLEAVARRVEAAAGGAASSTGDTGSTPALAYQFGGQSSLSGLLKSHGKAMLEDQMEYEQLFNGASFVVPLSAAEGGTGGGKSGGGTLSLWGSSNFINLDSDNDGLDSDNDWLDWDGQVVSINVGVDGLIGEKMLAGFALSSNQSSFDYVDSKSDDAYKQGEYNYSNTILHPYIGWFSGEGLKLWTSVGFGTGEIEIEIDTEEDVSSTDTTQQSLSGGFSRQLLNFTQTPGNTTTLNLKGDVSMTSVDVEENLEAGFAEQKVSSSRLRVLISGAQRHGLASGGGLTPSLEAGVRYDGGDGVTGTGVELGGGLRYANSGGNVTVAGNVRTLLAHDYNELGADFLLQRLPSAGRGLSLSLHPVWGKTQSVAEQLWNDGASKIAGEPGSDTSLQSSLDAEVGYGVTASILGAPGVLTPYTGMTATDGDTSRWRLGSRFAGGNGLSLNLEGTRENTAGGASHIVLLRGEVSF